MTSIIYYDYLYNDFDRFSFNFQWIFLYADINDKKLVWWLTHFSNYWTYFGSIIFPEYPGHFILHTLLQNRRWGIVKSVDLWIVIFLVFHIWPTIIDDSVQSSQIIKKHNCYNWLLGIENAPILRLEEVVVQNADSCNGTSIAELFSSWSIMTCWKESNHVSKLLISSGYNNPL